MDHKLECLDFVANEVMFADAFADKEPAPNFDGNQGIQTSFANGEVFPWSFGCTTDQITETWNASNSDQRKCLEMLIHDRTRMLLSISSSPALIAGISLSFGGVISAAAYLPTIFKTGRDFTAKATMKKVKKKWIWSEWIVPVETKKGESVLSIG